MIELIKLVLELIKNGFDIHKFTKEAVKDEIGYDLFELYCAFVEMVENGYKLLREMERVLERLETEPSYDGGSFGGIVKQQHMLLGTIERSFDHLRRELMIIDEKSYIKLVALMHCKVGYFGILIWEMKNYLLLTFDVNGFERDIHTMLEQHYGKYSYEHYLQTNSDIQSNRISKLGTLPFNKWNKSQRKSVKDFLDGGKQKKLLKKIEEQLSEFRVSLEKNFNIADILVGMRKRAKDSGDTPFIHFENNPLICTRQSG